MKSADSSGVIANELATLLRLLSRTELRVLILIARQFTTAQIAEHVCVSQRTIDKHRESLMNKLQLKGKGASALLLYTLSHREILAVLDDALRTPEKLEEYVEKYVALRR